ncbi:RidA family protein [Roseobacter sp. GAI101]|uniref:RidA family protein n=1 Tax=Roseobacter sp. (strain GAI101) TaxID=391589 RepID=UPI0005614193|nr:RidA family protein [Roseobacter sp. GAI101]
MNDIVRIETDTRRSRAVVYNGVVYVGGMTANDRNCGITSQTKQTLEKIESFLEKAGTDKTRVLTAQIWMKNLSRDFNDMNAVWNEWTSAGAAPTRATAQCEMGSPDVLIEIIVTAAVNELRTT